jgi:topoisomerase IV subunit B
LCTKTRSSTCFRQPSTSKRALDTLRYNHVIIATDADVDGMHIRLLLITFFLQFFPELIKNGHLYILQTPLFRVRNKKQTIYCYSEEERQKAIKEAGTQPRDYPIQRIGRDFAR